MADSFGQVNAMGVLSVTRAIGVPFLKAKYGDQCVTATPQVITTSLQDAAFMVMTTDGVHGVMSNDEICDVVRYSPGA